MLVLCVQQSDDGTRSLRVRQAVGSGQAGASLHGGKTRQLSHVEASHTFLSACAIMDTSGGIYGWIHLFSSHWEFQKRFQILGWHSPQNQKENTMCVRKIKTF